MQNRTYYVMFLRRWATLLKLSFNKEDLLRIGQCQGEQVHIFFVNGLHRPETSFNFHISLRKY